MTPSVVHLSANLFLPLGRGTLIDAAAQRQLSGEVGTLCTQLGQRLEATLEVMRSLLGVVADLPPRRPPPWTVLTEFENAAWPVLALSRPPALPVTDTARVIRHLATAHMPMEMARCRQWAQHETQREGTEPLLLALLEQGELTWAALLAAILTVQTQHVMLQSWGVLSAYVGLNTELRLQTARALLAALEQTPQLVSDPAGLAAEALWAALTLLHGGLPRPPTPQIVQLAQAMRTLPERTISENLPALATLLQELACLLPGLPTGPRHELADCLSGLRPTDPNIMTTGVLAMNQPGQSALWLRRAGEVQLIVCSTLMDSMVAQTEGQGPQLSVRAWRWRIPQRQSGMGQGGVEQGGELGQGRGWR